MKALIIEDETVAAIALQTLIGEIDPDIEIVGILQSIDESVEWFRTSSPPDLVFMDIHLADGQAFSIFDQVDVPCPLIFTTAYDEYALKAFEVNSIDYILKPINRKDLARAIGKYRNLNSRQEYNKELIINLLNTVRKQEAPAYKSFFLLPVKDKLIPLSAHDIAAIFIDNNMLKAISMTGQTYYLDRNLDEWMQQLDPMLFFRANRQYIVQRRAIRDVSIWFGGKLSVNLFIETKDRILVSKARAGEFKRWMEK